MLANADEKRYSCRPIWLDTRYGVMNDEVTVNKFRIGNNTCLGVVKEKEIEDKKTKNKSNDDRRKWKKNVRLRKG